MASLQVTQQETGCIVDEICRALYTADMMYTHTRVLGLNTNEVQELMKN
jgi:hypothetical protein